MMISIKHLINYIITSYNKLNQWLTICLKAKIKREDILVSSMSHNPELKITKF